MPILISKQIEKFLKSKIDNPENFSQSMLFWGQPQIGKFNTAKYFAKSILCKNNTWGGCNICDSCNYFKNNWHPDLMTIDTNENTIKKESLVDVNNFLMFKPLFSQKRILIINEAEKLNYETQSALLKSLEEPKPHFIIILVTSTPQKLLQTIQSRMLPIHFLKPKSENLINFLTENFKITKEKAHEISTISLNQTEKAISFIQDANVLKEKKTNEMFFKKLFQKTFFEQTLVLDEIIKQIEQKDKQEKEIDEAKDEEENSEKISSATKITNKHLKILINDWLEYIEINLNQSIVKENKTGLSIKQQQKLLKHTIRLLHYIENYNLNKKLLFDNFCLKTF